MPAGLRPGLRIQLQALVERSCLYWFTIRISNTSIAEGVARTFHRTVRGPCDCGSTEGSDRLKNPTVVRGFQSSRSHSRPPDESPVITAVAASSYATQLQLCTLLPISGSAAPVRIAWWVGVQRMSAERGTDEEASSSPSAEGTNGDWGRHGCEPQIRMHARLRANSSVVQPL